MRNLSPVCTWTCSRTFVHGEVTISMASTQLASCIAARTMVADQSSDRGISSVCRHIDRFKFVPWVVRCLHIHPPGRRECVPGRRRTNLTCVSHYAHQPGSAKRDEENKRARARNDRIGIAGRRGPPRREEGVFLLRPPEEEDPPPTWTTKLPRSSQCNCLWTPSLKA
jgi:hypothetical protein